jgi:peroxiredoxin
MNFLRFTCAIALVFLSGTLSAKGIRITGTLEGASEHKKVYLYEYFGPRLNKIDSTVLQDARFSFNTKKPVPRGFYRIGVSEDKSFAIILGEENPVVKANLSKQPVAATIEQSKENAVYEQYRQYNHAFAGNVNKLEQQARALQAKGSSTQQHEKEMEMIRVSYDSLLNEQSEFYKKLAADNKGLFAAKVAGTFVKQPDENADNFFASVNFNDKEMTRGDILQSKIMAYLQRYVQPSVESWEAAAENIVNKTSPESEIREVAYISFVSLFAQADADLARRVAKKYTNEFSNSVYAKELLAALPPAAPEVGEMAPDIKLQDRDGNVLPLSSLKGKVVLLDFWASWCGPCRHENPNVVKAYDKFKDKGFTIYSVSLDNNRDAWLKAIEKDKLSWNSHVSDLKGWKSAGAALYQVRGIPATFLIGKDGKIVARNLRGARLEEKLTELLGK